MKIHASCAARDGAAVLVTGPPGSGKSDLVLRLLHHGFTLVADDQVMIAAGAAGPPAELEGLLEVRGLGIVRVSHIAPVPLRLLVRLVIDRVPERLPVPQSHETFGLPILEIDPWQPSSAQRVSLALECATGTVRQLAGAFAA